MQKNDPQQQNRPKTRPMLNRVLQYVGIGSKQQFTRVKWVPRLTSRLPHQGAKECERRRRQYPMGLNHAKNQ